jgi:hypothetical protein
MVSHILVKLGIVEHDALIILVQSSVFLLIFLLTISPQYVLTVVPHFCAAEIENNNTIIVVEKCILNSVAF